MTEPVNLPGPNLPGPNLPAEEQARQWIETPVTFWETCYRDHGDLVRLDFGSLGAVILVSDPGIIRDIFRLSPDAFTIEEYNEHYRFVMGGESVLLSDGEMHLRKRKLLNPPFGKRELLEAAPMVAAIGGDILDLWPRGEPFNPRPTFHEFTLRVILQRLFGALDHPTARRIHAEYRARVLSQVGSWGPWQGFRKMHGFLEEILAREIAERREHPDSPGVLTRIINGRDESGYFISDEEIRHHVFTMLIAGVDTTAITLTWCLYWLSAQPVVLERLHDELGGDQPIEELLRHGYLDAVYSETRRMFPTVTTPSGRRLTRAATLGGREFPAGATLVPCTYLVHRREDLYPYSDSFIPQRFLDRNYGPHEFFPTGGGNRTCLGIMLSMFEFKIMLAEIARRFTLDARPPAEPVVPERHGTFLAPPEAFRVTARERKA